MKPKITLLVVDDDKNICDAVKRGLEQTHDYAVHVATNGAQAVAAAGELLPDVILLDLMMPQMTGAECSKRLRDAPQTAHIPVIYLTGLMGKEDAKALDGIIDGERYLAKPVCINEIIEAVERVLELGKREQHVPPW